MDSAHPPLLDRSRRSVLRAATGVLVVAPQTTLAELAVTLGIGRTTLHRLFPTRDDLLRAIAHDALDELGVVYTEAGVTADPQEPHEAIAAVRRLVGALVPLGPSLMFLLRASELDDDQALERRSEEVDRPLLRCVAVAQADGDLDPSLPVWWVVEMLLAAVYIGWEQIEKGRLAPLDAPDLVMRTWLRGVSPGGVSTRRA